MLPSAIVAWLSAGVDIVAIKHSVQDKYDVQMPVVRHDTVGEQTHVAALHRRGQHALKRRVLRSYVKSVCRLWAIEHVIHHIARNHTCRSPHIDRRLVLYAATKRSAAWAVKSIQPTTGYSQIQRKGS
jgi:hypothetical protein